MIGLILELGNLTASEKAAIISARTSSPISLAELENLLSFEGLAWRNEITGAWEGTLIDTMSLGGEVGEGLAELFRHMNKARSVHIETDKNEWALKCKNLLDALLLMGVITQDQSDKVIALGGGHPYGQVTELEVAAEQQQYEDEQALQSATDELYNKFWSLHNLYIAPLNDSRNTQSSDWKAALENMASDWSN